MKVLRQTLLLRKTTCQKSKDPQQISRALFLFTFLSTHLNNAEEAEVNVHAFSCSDCILVGGRIYSNGFFCLVNFGQQVFSSKGFVSRIIREPVELRM